MSSLVDSSLELATRITHTLLQERSATQLCAPKRFNAFIPGMPVRRRPRSGRGPPLKPPPSTWAPSRPFAPRNRCLPGHGVATLPPPAFRLFARPAARSTQTPRASVRVGARRPGPTGTGSTLWKAPARRRAAATRKPLPVRVAAEFIHKRGDDGGTPRPRARAHGSEANFREARSRQRVGVGRGLERRRYGSSRGRASYFSFSGGAARLEPFSSVELAASAGRAAAR